MSIFHLKCQTVGEFGEVDDVILHNIFWNHPKNFLAVIFLIVMWQVVSSFWSLLLKKRPCIEMHELNWWVKKDLLLSCASKNNHVAFFQDVSQMLGDFLLVFHSEKFLQPEFYGHY